MREMNCPAQIDCPRCDTGYIARPHAWELVAVDPNFPVLDRRVAFHVFSDIADVRLEGLGMGQSFCVVKKIPANLVFKAGNAHGKWVGDGQLRRLIEDQLAHPFSRFQPCLVGCGVDAPSFEGVET